MEGCTSNEVKDASALTYLLRYRAHRRIISTCPLCECIKVAWTDPDNLAVLVYIYYSNLQIPLFHFIISQPLIQWHKLARDKAMVFLAEKTVPVPNKDIISWIFDEVPYHQDQPVSVHASPTSSANTRGIMHG